MSSSPSTQASQLILTHSTDIEYYLNKAHRLRSTYLLQIAQKATLPTPALAPKVYKPLYTRHKLPFNTHLIAAVLR